MINLFLQYIQYEKNYSSHTVLSYSNDLQEFVNYLSLAPQDFKPDQITFEDIRLWMMHMLDKGYSTTSVNRKLSTLKSFYRFLNRRGLCVNNPTQKIISPKNPKKIPAFFQENDMEKVLENEQKYITFEQLRDILIIDFLYETGLRRSELINLRESDINFSTKEFKVIGKRNKERVIPFGENLKGNMLRYIDIRNKEVENPTAYLFVLKNGKQLYPKIVYNVVTKYMSQVSTQTKNGPHVLRHTFATEMLNNGADINALKELLGHSSLAATQVYTHTTFEQLAKIYEQAHPRAKTIRRKNYGSKNSRH